MDSLISVIVPVYNVEKYLPLCLRAISEQTYQNLEIILVDDGSTDRSGFLCDEFAAQDTRARVIHQSNTGLWAARNTGHDAAHGEYLWFPDGDDYFHKDFLRIMYEAIQGYDLAICQKKKTNRLDENISSPVPVRLEEITQDALFLSLFCKSRSDFAHCIWNKLFRRRIIDNHRNNPYPVAQDRDFLMRLFLSIKEAILVDNHLYYWVQHSDSIMHSPTFPARRSMCHVRMDYCCYQSLRDDGAKYKYLILEDLYNHILLWRSLTWNSADRKHVSSECKSIINHTLGSFLRCRETPILKRAACLFLAMFPRLAHFIIIQLTR